MQFGVQDAVTLLVETKLKDESGRTLWIANHAIHYSFIAPLYAREEGLCLSADPRESYSPMPSGNELMVYQAAGLIPKHLPEPRLQTSDWIFGFLLWWVFIGVTAYELIKRKIKKKFGREKSVATPAVEPVGEPKTEPQSQEAVPKDEEYDDDYDEEEE
ncbi:MAG: hypothetical protein GC165_10335 [Armatimonadetes bacterium]|nr:hypothetical protein [Armatimonadota bacterium]